MNKVKTRSTRLFFSGTKKFNKKDKLPSIKKVNNGYKYSAGIPKYLFLIFPFKYKSKKVAIPLPIKKIKL